MEELLDIARFYDEENPENPDTLIIRDFIVLTRQDIHLNLDTITFNSKEVIHQLSDIAVFASVVF